MPDLITWSDTKPLVARGHCRESVTPAGFTIYSLRHPYEDAMTMGATYDGKLDLPPHLAPSIVVPNKNQAAKKAAADKLRAACEKALAALSLPS